MSNINYPGYTDATPSAGLLVGTSKPLTVTILDEDGEPITGAEANIDLSIYDPSGNETEVDGSSLSEIGVTGVYEYEHVFDEAGYWVWTWSYSAGGESAVVGNYLRAHAVRTAVG